jgi:hypothetical protein
MGAFLLGSEVRCAMRNQESKAKQEDGDRIGIFPSWKSLYISVVVYTAALIAVLYLLTVLLDFSVR